MLKFSRAVVKHKNIILIIAILLLIPSILGIINTRVNYDILDYLPEDMDTVKGQNILLDDFGKGAFSLVIVDGMKPYEVASLKSELEKVEHVNDVVWYDNLFDVTVPMEILPEKYYDAFNKGDSTLMAVFFDTSTSEDATINAIGDVRKVCGEKCFITGMSALVTDLKNLCEKEEPVYVGIAVLLACAAMMIFMDSWVIPFVFLISIGIAILYNLGSNYFLGEISYITKALSAVLQLAVTMDYSIFLWHSYSEHKIAFNGDKKEAMSTAIAETFTSVLGSSITTIAGFIALCFMTFTLGKDLGIVMAKGVLLGVIGCVTILPPLILVFDKLIEKTRHRSLIPSMDKVSRLIIKRPIIFIIIFVLLLLPSLYGYTNELVYYDMSTVVPKDMEYVIANTKLIDDFDIASTHMILADSNMSHKDCKNMIGQIENVDGVKFAIGFDSLIGSTIPQEILPDSIVNLLKEDKYQLFLVSSKYYVSSDEVNSQITDINNIIKKYDENGMLIGEAPCTKDLIDVTDRDFTVVSIISIAAIFLIILFVLKSPSLAVILVAVIEFAICINLGIPYYANTSLPFIAPICISTIQLGATVDYAILMTTRYKKERIIGHDKKVAISTALSTSIPSIIVSALGFFAATYGVAVYSDIDIISSMCNLMARGALISMASVILILPSMFMVFDKIICKTTVDIRKSKKLVQLNK
ncbi:MMPL family transporter [Sedimentibacter sp. zth1]|uniref:efflux RND transporter permease subunit n=1 Tax=Sedimentibacter sp. zth1 TaxID=2816908 RepID=UPI001A91DF30|nr:MMPL family transporter [Sedimentibacter sp. zth1]QSX06917.1 MMPL family transporter [Sedimentibacter sp. zth1]